MEDLLPVHDIQGVITRILIVLDSADRAEKLVGTAHVHIPGAGQRRVVVIAAIQVNRVRADVFDVERAAVPQSSLQIEDSTGSCIASGDRD